MVENCIQFNSPIPMCNKQFLIHEPEVELGYVQGMFTGYNMPFFAKLWKSKQNRLKYVTIIFDLCRKESEWQSSDDEVISVLNKSGFEVIGQMHDAMELSKLMQFLFRHGIFRYAPNQPILHYSCYVCKDRDNNEFIAYTTEVTELYEDETIKTICNLKFKTSQYSKRATELLEWKVGNLRSQRDFQERFQIVKEAIDQWDYIGVGEDSPDEYDIESDKIAAIINKDNSVDEIAEAISHVFSLMFTSDKYNTPEKCICPAKLIREEFDMKYFGVVDNSGRQKIANDKVNTFLISGDWIYYVNRNDRRSMYRTCTDGTEMIHFESSANCDCIYKVRTDGTGRKKLNNDQSGNIIIDEDWIYYKNEKNNSICRIRTDGSGRQDLKKKCDGYSLQVKNDWVFYRNSGVCKIDKNGGSRQRLCVGDIWNYKTDSEWLYYRSEYRLYKIHIDGGESSLVFDDNIKDFDLHDGWVYYSNSDDDNKLYRVCTDGSGRQKLIDSEAVNLTFSDGWLYYIKNVKKEFKPDHFSTKQMGIFKMRLDGSEQQMLTDVECRSYMADAASGWVYFSNGDDGSTMYKMRIDGTDVKKLNNDVSSHMQVTGEWIYYLKGKPGYRKLYRIPVDGITEGG